jgi:hypothetical protein
MTSLSLSPKVLRSVAATNARHFALGVLVLVFLFVFCDSEQAEHEYEYEHAPAALVTSIENDLEFDDHQKLVSHHIVFPANRPDCPTHAWETGKIHPGYGYEPHAVDGDALARVFPHYGTGESYLGRDEENENENNVAHKNKIEHEIEHENGNRIDNRCMAACLEKGTDRKVAGHTMPHFQYAAARDGSESSFQQKSKLENWFMTSCRRLEICFINYAVRDRPLEVFWIDSKNGDKRKKQFDLKYSDRKTTCFYSFGGHQFEVVDEESGFYEKVTIEHTSTMAFGTSPPSSSQRFDGINEVERTVKQALDMEWRKHKMVDRTFSSLGFAKGKLPDDVFANMAAFYYNNRNNVVNEEWEGKGVFVNWWETDVKFVSIPWDTKRKWQIRLSELVSAWAGVEVEETSMYGLRQYETGARLLSHVDRLPTHAVSLIVNIAQNNLANPWPVEIFDHADRLHEITMEAGEIVYYESAKNLHSRNRPLTCKKGGCSFVNLFTHYRPVHDGSKWYQNLSDMPNRPPPLLEGQVNYDTHEGACKHMGATGVEIGVETTDTTTNDNVLGIGNVECDDHRLGHFISPTLFKAREADDLFRWWKSTANANLIGFDENKNGVYYANANLIGLNENKNAVYHETLGEKEENSYNDNVDNVDDDVDDLVGKDEL